MTARAGHTPCPGQGPAGTRPISSTRQRLSDSLRRLRPSRATLNTRPDSAAVGTAGGTRKIAHILANREREWERETAGLEWHVWGMAESCILTQPSRLICKCVHVKASNFRIPVLYAIIIPHMPSLAAPWFVSAWFLFPPPLSQLPSPRYLAPLPSLSAAQLRAAARSLSVSGPRSSDARTAFPAKRRGAPPASALTEQEGDSIITPGLLGRRPAA